MISPDLSMLERTRICSILGSFSGLFEFNKFPSNLTSTAKHKINTEDHPPIKRRPYRVSQVERQTIQNEVDKMLKGGIVQLSESPWSSPVVLVKKKNGSWRFCVDYRHLNKITKKDVYPLPRIDDTLDCLRGASYYSSMDLRSGYWQIEVDEADREKTAFITPDGLYEFKVMPFGLCNAPATFERMMDTLLRGLKWSMCLCYLDDIIVFSPTFDEHVRRLELVLRCLSKAGLVLNPDKCLFGTKRLSIFGHLVDGEGVHPDPGKVDAMSKFPTPKSLTDVRSFIGMCSYYRRFIKNFAQKAEPLHRLLRKDTRFEWGPDQRQAYESLKLALASEPVLAHFDEKYATELHTDASGFGIGAVLVQVQGGSEKPIYDCGKWMRDYERIARSNCWDATMKLANAPFFLEGTAGQWYDNNEEGMDSWDMFKEMFSRTFDNSGVLLRRAKDNLQSRAQKSTESCESYIQDVLSLCRQVNPDMSQGEKVAHLMKGVVEDVYQVILIKEIDTVEAFVDWCRKVEACKQRRIGKPRFERLPNVASIEQPNSSSLEDLIRRIVREEIKSALHFESIVPEVNSLKKIIHEEQAPFAGGKVAEEIINPPPLIAAKLSQNIVDVTIDDKTFPALVDSGASFSVISDHFRQQHKKTMFSDAGMTLRVADGKYLVSRGRCTLRLEINGLVQPFEFIVLPSCSHDIILGWDFLEASRAIIDCGSAEILLEKTELPEDSSSIFQTVAADDSFIIPAGSTKQINVISETILGVSDVVLEPSRILFLEHDLMVPASIFAVQHGKGRIWITNIGTCDRTVPKGMCIGEIQVLEEGQLAVIGDASDTNLQEILGQENSPNIASMISPDLSMLERTRICSILGSFSGLFEFNKFPSNLTTTAKHKINTEDHPPIKRRPYRVSQVERQTIQNEVDKMLKGGIVQLSESPWSSPVVLVKKKNGSWRFCVDYRHLNKITKKDVYPLPRIDDTLDCLRGASYYSSMDLRSGYWQIEVDEADREKTAFITPDGLYEFKVMPFGLCNAQRHLKE
ncbi:hypothetical protein LAZ67_2000988 [Cordylochernes scorpioides]|uniref:Reverse transcriptase domain-containing protein n=1 Tax=Cordylochernes scorpioides TaxID=51811 RepID=A0ABY6K431_9ARAC|nr:hypothetical protein LAZ67_2000988 [Cordylochernes scorpioides]